MICAVNSIYSVDSSLREFFEPYPDCTSFALVSGILNDDLAPGDRFFYFEALPCSGDEVSLNFKNLFLYERRAHTGFKWKVDNDAFNQIEPSLRKKVKKAFDEKAKPILPSIQAGAVRVLINTCRFYNEKNLTKLFADNDFAVEAISLSDRLGHRVYTSDPFGKGEQLTIIARNRVWKQQEQYIQ